MLPRSKSRSKFCSVSSETSSPLKKFTRRMVRTMNLTVAIGAAAIEEEN
jgi:hypothetical protein